MVCMDAGVYRRGVAELGYRQGRGGAGAMRERNRRAREYSRMCRTRRWCMRMWVVAIVLWVMLLVLVAWCLTLPPVQEDVVQSPPTADIAEPEPENLLVCDITGYCACCTPYAHMNQRRHERCHGECEDYKAFRRDVEANKAKRYASYSEADFYSMNSARRENAKKAIRKRDGR